MRELLSKLVAGGLSAAVILLWWPRFFPADNAATWLIRGGVWTLSFELLLHALLPIEAAIWESRPGRTIRHRATRLGAPRRSSRGRAMTATLALAVPLALLSFAPTPPSKDAAAAAPVRHVTEVKRIVKVERKQVRVPQVVPVAQPAPVAQQVADRPLPTAAPRVTKRPGTHPQAAAPQTSSGPKQMPATGNDSTAPAPPAGSQEQTASAPRVVRRPGSA